VAVLRVAYGELLPTQTSTSWHNVPDKLPPSNPNALGLHLTDEEWRTVLELLWAEPAILQARVYGSRKSGVRRPKDPAEPIDVDIVVQVAPSYHGEAPFTVLFDLKRRLEEHGQALRLQIEDLTDSRSEFFADRQAGILIVDRLAMNEG
jgi:hypothetical protein